MNRTRVAILCLALAAGGALATPGLLPAPADGTPAVVPGPSTIDAVTVYQNRCMITRSIAGEFAPGLYTWEFRGLPLDLLDESVRVTGKGTAAARILDLRIDRMPAAEGDREAVAGLEKKLQDVEAQIQEVADRLDVMNKKAEFVKGLIVLKPADDKTGGSPAGTAAGSSSDTWQKRLDFIDSQLTRILEQTRTLNVQKKDLETKKADIDYQLELQASLQTRQRKTVFVAVEISRPGTERLDLSYVLRSVSWTPAYDLRIDSTKNEAVLTYQALVRQTTGEDWMNVALSLSTAEPAVQSQQRRLQPWTVDTATSAVGSVQCAVTDTEGSPLPGATVTLASSTLTRKLEADANGRVSFVNLKPDTYDLTAALLGFKTVTRPGIQVRPGRSARLDIKLAQAALEESVTVKTEVKYEDAKAAVPPPPAEETEATIETSAVTDKTVAAVFNIKQRQTIPSSGAAKKVTIAVVSLPVEKTYVTIPKVAESVSLVAAITNAADALLLPGPAGVFYDNDFISTAQIPLASSGDRFSVNVGEVPGVKARWRLISRTRGESGLVGKKVQLVYEIGITLESLLGAPQTVTVKDQVPVTTSKDVVIDILQVTPEPVKSAVDAADTGAAQEAKDGTVTWLITLQPQEKKEIRLKFRITYPKGSPLIEGTA